MLAESAGIDWNTLLQQPDALGMIIGFSATTIIIVGVTIAVQWRKAVQARYAADLTARMIERGFTADDIERVLSAGATQRRRGKHSAVVGVCIPGGKDNARGGAAKSPMGCC